MTKQADTNPFPYSDSNKRYYTYDYFMRQKFGRKCAKLPIDGGFTCPNRDGTCGTGGCTYCSARGSGDFCADRSLPVRAQLEQMRAVMSEKWADSLGIAYFQAFTNTYAPVSVLRTKFEEALAFPGIVGLSIATRADCLPGDVCELLAELAERTFLTVELGLQTVHDDTARRINRGHTYAQFLDGYRRLRAASEKIAIAIHLINGLPGETDADMMENAIGAAALRPDQLKLHLLHVIEGTRLCEEYRAGGVRCMELEEYAGLVVRQLERMPPRTVIGRVTGDGMGSALVAPLWSRKKLTVMNAVDRIFYDRKTWQGRFFE